MMLRIFLTTALLTLLPFSSIAAGRDYGWYAEGDYIPEIRIKLTLVNTLDFRRSDCPVAITRAMMPIANISDHWVTVVDPTLPPLPKPTEEQLKEIGGWQPREESNGHYLHYQLDDLDKDGVWDELYFVVDIDAGETKTIYLYIQKPERPWLRGLYPHDTHAVVGNYERNYICWWESKLIGWKLAYPTDVDMYGKREPILVSAEECINNWAGYNRPYKYGTDILMVADTFGAAGICLFEEPAIPDSVSRPRFTPYSGEGQFIDTRYSRDVVVNGPLRSMIVVRTMNWRSGKGVYELEQYYTAYKNKSHSTCKAVFTTFLPEETNVSFGCGMRTIMNEYDSRHTGGTVISYGRNVEIESPSPDESKEERLRLILDFEGIALVVKDKYKPEYQKLESYGGNHAFRMPVNDTKTIEYLFAGAWSEGTVNRTAEEFSEYVRKAALEFNNPLEIAGVKIENK